MYSLRTTVVLSATSSFSGCGLTSAPVHPVSTELLDWSIFPKFRVLFLNISLMIASAGHDPSYECRKAHFSATCNISGFKPSGPSQGSRRTSVLRSSILFGWNMFDASKPCLGRTISPLKEVTFADESTTVRHTTGQTDAMHTFSVLASCGAKCGILVAFRTLLQAWGCGIRSTASCRCISVHLTNENGSQRTAPALKRRPHLWIAPIGYERNKVGKGSCGGPTAARQVRRRRK